MIATQHSRSISVSWDTIECIERNGPITGYAVRFHQTNGTIVPGMVTGQTFISNGLIPYSNYEFHVAGFNNNGTGPYTGTLTILTEEESKMNFLEITLL